MGEPVYDPSLETSPYEQAVAQHAVPSNVKRCEVCKGTGKTGPSVCLNCEGMGGVLK